MGKEFDIMMVWLSGLSVLISMMFIVMILNVPFVMPLLVFAAVIVAYQAGRATTGFLWRTK